MYVYAYTNIYKHTYSCELIRNIHTRRLRKKLRDTVVLPTYLDSITRIRASIDEINEAKWTDGMSNSQAANVTRLYEQLATVEVCFVYLCVCVCMSILRIYVCVCMYEHLAYVEVCFVYLYVCVCV